MGRLLGCFDFILHTVSSPHNKQVYNMLWDGLLIYSMCLLSSPLTSPL